MMWGIQKILHKHSKKKTKKSFADLSLKVPLLDLY